MNQKRLATQPTAATSGGNDEAFLDENRQKYTDEAFLRRKKSAIRKRLMEIRASDAIRSGPWSQPE